MKNVKENNKGITLIALVITIIVLLILAGISIAMLTGDNGILKKATTSKERTSQSTAEEKVKIAVAGSYDASGRINIDELNSNLENIEGIDKSGLPITELPATVVIDGYVFEITEEKVEIKVGVEIEQRSMTFLKGSTLAQTLTANRLNNEEGTITWSVAGNITLSAREGNSVEVSLNSEAEIGDIATVTATLGEYSDKIDIKVVGQATEIIADTILVNVGKTAKIVGIETPSNSEELAEISYMSNNTSIATVNEDGIVSGVAEGTTTITITGKGKWSNATVTGTCSVIVDSYRINVGDLDMAFNISKGGTIMENNDEYTLTGNCWLETREVTSNNFKIEFDWKQPSSFTPFAYIINTGYTGSYENGQRRKTIDYR